jgi:hypothetical protein
MYKKLETLGSSLLERLVPKAEASAAADAPCYKCFTGSGCEHTDNHWWAYSRDCRTNWVYMYCDDCR